MIIPKWRLPPAAILFIFLAGLGVLLSPRLESKKPTQPISKSESSASSGGIVSPQGLSPGEVLQAGFSSGVEKFSTLAEVRAAKAFKTPQEKRNYLRILEGYGFRGAEAVAFLKTALNDPDLEVRRAEMRGLGRTETR